MLTISGVRTSSQCSPGMDVGADTDGVVGYGVPLNAPQVEYSLYSGSGLSPCVGSLSYSPVCVVGVSVGVSKAPIHVCRFVVEHSL